MKRRTQTAAAVGAAGAGAAAVGVAAVSACCVGPVLSPLLVGALGAGGAVWAAALEPYSLYILAGSAVALGYGFVVSYRRPRACAVGEDAEKRRTGPSPRWLRITLWTAALLWVASLVVNLVLAHLAK